MTNATATDLKGLPLFSALSDGELDVIAPFFTVRKYPKDAVVITEGESVGVLSFILSGRTRHFWRDENGQEMDLVVLSAGDGFGQASLIDMPMMVSSITVEPLVVATISRDDFEALLTRFPSLAVRLLKETIGVVRELIQRAKVFSTEGVYGRVVWMLERRAKPLDGQLVTERLTQADIARRVGATREMVGQVLRDLARGGYIAASNGRFMILKKPPRRR
jgi:CRP/FNR family cyclic AMP-dependent transcriptional regulator